ncbi:glycosyltransferase family 4 protein [Bacillus sp. CMF12]|uniref:glycosyltransferase family 4 protein n=1 Tax=Bacillus sp. CMF12 TaxID=2884834 RepID=UPI0020799990|nr:glycosyltransferase family 4 protein [Bacillus sp. CMF12]USK49620.1 glycosyltransferase family 4 protein [Bacillus sp. CMF12]
MMKTVYFIIDAPFGYISNGRANWLYNIVEQFENNANYKVSVICRSPYKRTKIYDLEKIKNAKISEIKFTDTKSIYFRFLDKASFRTFNLLRSFYFSLASTITLSRIKENDIIFALNPGFEVLPGILLKKVLKKKITVFCVMKGLFAEEQYRRIGFLKKFFYRFERETLKACDKIFSNGFDSKDYIYEKHNLKAIILPNGVNIKQYSEINNENLYKDEEAFRKYKFILNQSKDKKIIMQIGSISEYKGINFLLSAVQELSKSRNDFILILIGKGTENVFYNNYINKNKLDGIVYMIDEIPSEFIKNFLAIADMITNLSVFGIGISMATLESLAVQKINIAWDNKIYNQFLSGEEVVYVKNKDVKDLAEKISSVLSDLNAYKRLAENGVKKAETYDWENIYLKLLREINI